MVKITKNGDQYRINIPKNLMRQIGWDENTEVTIIPYPKDPNDQITEETPILIKKIIMRTSNG